MDLTTAIRVKNFIDDANADATALRQIVSDISKSIIKALNREVRKQEYTEYFDIRKGQEVFQLKAYPVVTGATFKVYHDSVREFSESTLIDSSNYDINSGADEGILTIDDYTLTAGSGYLKVVYTGGLATVTAEMTVTTSGESGSFAAENIIIGGTSGAIATVVSFSDHTLKATVTAGVFVVGETITAGSKSAVIDSIDVNPLVMAYPDLAGACEKQSGFVYQRRTQIGVSSMSVEGGSVSFYKDQFQPEVKGVIERYRKIFYG